MKIPELYRKRLIPAQNIPLKDDIILFVSDEIIVTKWTTINPKIEFNHGTSCYFFKEGVKISKFYQTDNSLLYWYCDIVDYEYDKESNRLTVTDLLADVIIYPDGAVKVVDLDEMADALGQGVLSAELLQQALYRLDKLLTKIYNGEFNKMQQILEKSEK